KTRDYVFVGDVVNAFLMAHERLQESALDDAYNVASGVETRDSEVFETVMRTMHEVGSDPDAPAEFQNSLKVSKPAFAEVRPGEVTRSWLDVGKAEVYLGWKARVSFYQGAKQTVRN